MVLTEPAGREAVLLASSLLLTHQTMLGPAGLTGLANFLNHLCTMDLDSHSGWWWDFLSFRLRDYISTDIAGKLHQPAICRSMYVFTALEWLSRKIYKGKGVLIAWSAFISPEALRVAVSPLHFTTDTKT